MDIEQWAIDRASQWLNGPYGPHQGYGNAALEELAWQFTVARAEGRREGLEEAGTLVDTWVEDAKRKEKNIAYTLMNLAVRIRAKKG